MMVAMSIDNSTDEITDEAVEAAADRVFSAVLGAMSCQAMFLGDRLGWYEALARADSLCSVELAEATGTDSRYAREWLEQQTVTVRNRDTLQQDRIAVDQLATYLTERIAG